MLICLLQFDVVATDNGVPKSSGTARVTIIINRVGLPSLIDSGVIIISDTIQVGVEFVKIRGRHPINGVS